MFPYLNEFNTMVAVGVVIMQILIILLSANLLFFRSRDNFTLHLFKKYGFIIGFLIGLGTILLSLFYSNIIGFPACELCWIQRIFLYPQAILFGMELYKKDQTMVDFSLVLAFIGSIVSIFHIYIENGGASSLACSTGNATTISCATRYVYEFGYITIPTMALTASVFIILLLVNYKYMSRK